MNREVVKAVSKLYVNHAKAQMDKNKKLDPDMLKKDAVIEKVAEEEMTLQKYIEAEMRKVDYKII